MEGLGGEEKLKIAASDNDESVFLFFLVAIENMKKISQILSILTWE